MPSLAELTDAYAPDDTFPVEQPAAPIKVVIRTPKKDKKEDKIAADDGVLSRIINRLTGSNGEERYQTWPEKVVREAIAAPHAAMTEGTMAPGLRREDFTDIPAPQMPTKDSTWLGNALGVAPVASSPADPLIDKAQAMSALAGSGGLAGTTDATLGSAPFLRPALKYENKIYKAPVNGQHLDALPAHLQDTFQKQAMSGEDISNFNFGFMNHKGQFLNREAALDYAIKEGLIDPHAGKYGALTTSLLADSSKPGTAIEAMAKTNAQPFFSAVEHQINQIAQPKMTGDQWLGTLSNKPGVKPEELDWTGLKDFLQEKGKQPVTRQEVQDFVAANKVELRDVHKGELKFNKDSPYALKEVIRAAKEAGDTPGDLELVLANDGNAYRALTKKFPELSNDEDWAAKVSKSVFGGDSMPAGTTKYHSYQLPGGENYREMLLTLPTKSNSVADMLTLFPSILYEIKTPKDVSLARQHNPNFRESFKGVEDKDILDNIALADKLSKTSDYKSSHWDEPNILAHVRMNDRTMPVDTYYKVEGLGKDFKTREEAYAARDEAGLAGKSSVTEHQNKKSLHLEEIQSDWHQQGRDKGYKSNKPPTKDDVELKFIKSEVPDGHDPSNYPGYWESFDKQGNMISRHGGRLTEEQAMAEALGDMKHKATVTVPDAPFKKSWHELALKRMIREVAEKGYDRLSWTPGEAQAARYDLSKSIENIHITNSNEGFHVNLNAKSGVHGSANVDSSGKILKGYDSFKDGAGKNLSDYVGKELSEKILDRANNPPPRPEKLPNGYELIKDGNKWGVTPPGQIHARSMVGMHQSKDEAIRQAINHIHSEQAQKHAVIENIDLRIGGEGMKGFYDQIIPKALEKISKEHGVKVKQSTIPSTEGTYKYIGPEKDINEVIKLYDRKVFTASLNAQMSDVLADMGSGTKFTEAMGKHGSKALAEKFGGELKPILKQQPIHYIDIPQSLKDQALHKGFPLFSGGYQFIPVVGNPFGDKDNK